MSAATKSGDIGGGGGGGGDRPASLSIGDALNMVPTQAFRLHLPPVKTSLPPQVSPNTLNNSEPISGAAKI